MNFKSVIYPEDSIILAPLSGFTDAPYRASARRHGCYYLFTEMVDASSVVYANYQSEKMLLRRPDEEWLGVQLVGGQKDRIEKAVEILNRHEFGLLDFNLGCPAPKIARKGAGAILGMQPDLAASIFERIVKLSRFPVTAKIRILDEHDPEPTLYLCRLLRDAGARAITIHGRIKKAIYSGPVFSGIIAAVRDELDIQIIANGGVMNYRSYQTLRNESKCSCVMLARGAMGNPWLFRRLQEPDNFVAPSLDEFLEEMNAHVSDMLDYYGEDLGCKVCRKVILDYMKGRGFPRELKSLVSFICTRNDFQAYLQRLRDDFSEENAQRAAEAPDNDRGLRL